MIFGRRGFGRAAFVWGGAKKEKALRGATLDKEQRERPHP